MARLPRYFVQGVPLHIIQRGNNRAPIFAVGKDLEFYRHHLGKVAAAHGLAIHAYVLMTNHVHLLATPQSATSAPKAMQALGGRYARHFNWMYGRTGTLWEGRYKAAPVDTEAYLLTCMRYIELNPVRAGLASEPAAYRWSSHGANAHGVADPLVVAHPLYKQLGSTPALRQAAYRELFELELGDRDLVAIRDATNHAWALGSRRFQADTEMASRRRAARMPLGRPARTRGPKVGSDTTLMSSRTITAATGEVVADPTSDRK
jgi:putative transposase